MEDTKSSKEKKFDTINSSELELPNIKKEQAEKYYVDNEKEIKNKNYGNAFGFRDKNGNEIQITLIDKVKEKHFDSILDKKDKEINKINKDTKEVDINSKEINKNKKEETVKPENEVEEILKSLLERTDIESMTITIVINNERQVFSDNEEIKNLGKSEIKYLPRQEQVEKVKETLKSFDDVIVVHSKEVLKKLQEDYKRGKETEGIKKEIPKIKNNLDYIMKHQITRAYVRISDEDFTNIKSILKQNNIQYISNESGIKNGVNIVTFAEKREELKKILADNNKDILQDMVGNDDWNNVKTISKYYTDVSKENFEKFKEENKDKFEYIAFESKGSISIYVNEKCNIKIEGIEKANKYYTKEDDRITFNDLCKNKDEYKKNTAQKVIESKNINKSVNKNKNQEVR